MVSSTIFWGSFGLVVRFWQLGIEKRPFLGKEAIWAYPIFGTVGASFGYWMQGVEDRQIAILSERRDRLLEKRRRRDERRRALAEQGVGGEEIRAGIHI